MEISNLDTKEKFLAKEETDFNSENCLENTQSIDTRINLLNRDLLKKSVPKRLELDLKEARCLDFNTDETMCYVGSSGGLLAKVDLRNSQTTCKKTKVISCIALHEAKNLVFLGLAEGGIEVFDADTLANSKSIPGHINEVTRLVIREDYLYSSGKDSQVVIWDLQTMTPKVLHTHNHPVLGLALNTQSTIVASSDLEGIIMVQKVSVHTLKIQSGMKEVWSLALSYDSTYLAAGGGKGQIEIWNLKKMKLEKLFTQHKDKITFLEFIKETYCLISCSFDKHVRVWDIANNFSEVLEGHNEKVMQCYVSKDSNYFYTIGGFEVLVWELSSSLPTRQVSSQPDRISQILINGLKECAICNRSHYIDFIHLASGNRVAFYEPLEEVICIEQSKDQRVLFILTRKKVIKYSITTNSEMHQAEYPRGEYSLNSKLKVTEDKVLLATGKGIEIYTVADLHLRSTIELNSKCIEVSNDESKLFVGKSKGEIEIYDLSNLGLFKHTKEHCSEIKHLQITSDDKLLVSSESTRIRIWFVETMECFRNVIPGGEINTFCLTNQEKFLVTITSQKIIKFWDLVHFVLLFETLVSQECSSAVENPTSKETMFSEMGNVLAVPHINIHSDFTITCKYITKQGFCQYILAQINYEETLTNIPMYNQAVIFPHVLNSLHILSFYGKEKLLKRSLKDNASFVFNSKSPLEIALEKGYSAIQKVLVKHIAKQGKINHEELWVVAESLNQLNFSGLKCLQTLYSAIYGPIKFRTQVFCSKSLKLPHYIESETLNPDMSQLPVDKNNTKVHIYSSFIPLPLTKGSRLSLNFLESLKSCPNNQVLTTEFIKVFLDYKWQKARTLLYFQSLVFLVYLCALSTYVILGSSYEMLWVIFLTNAVLVFYECLQITLLKTKYWKKISSYISICQFVMWLVYFSVESQESNNILGIIIFVSLVKGTSCFRLFKNTRYLVNLILQVMKDMTSFSVLLFYSTFGFALIFTATSGQNNFIKVLSHSFFIDFAEFFIEVPNPVECFFFVVVTFVNTLMMLNLLISIIGDTFDKVQESRELAESLEVIDLVIEAEYLAFWNRENQTMKYLAVVSRGVNHSEDETWNGKISEIKKKLLVMDSQISCSNEAIQKLVRDKIDRLEANTNKELLEIKRSLKEINEKVN